MPVGKSSRYEVSPLHSVSLVWWCKSNQCTFRGSTRRTLRYDWRELVLSTTNRCGECTCWCRQSHCSTVGSTLSHRMSTIQTCNVLKFCDIMWNSRSWLYFHPRSFLLMKVTSVKEPGGDLIYESSKIGFIHQSKSTVERTMFILDRIILHVSFKWYHYNQQECIPVGCVPPICWP